MKILLIAALILGSFTSTAFADCTASGIGCSDITFLTNGIGILSSCTAATNVLMADLNVSKTSAQFDASWTTFCGSTCYSSMASIDVSQRCCIDAYGLGTMFQNLLQFCQYSKQSPTRRCGAELGNLGLVACSATNANDCTNLGTCEWTQGMCLYKPQQSSLELICSDCNRAYFANFPTGGVNSMDSYSKIAPVFDFACNKIDDQYCLLTAAARGYNSAGALNSSDLTAYCASSDSTAKRCFRALTATTAKSLVHSARVALLTCDTSTEAACQTTFGSTLTLAAALEASAATMCSNNGASNCFGLGGAAMTDSCFGYTVGTSSCAGCDSTTSAVASSLGCCSPVFSTSGALVAAAAPAGRLLLASIAADAGNVNQTQTYPRTPLTASVLAYYLAQTKSTATQDTFAAVATCSNYSSQYAALVASKSSCTVRPYSRTYTFGLQLNYTSYGLCANADIVKSTLIADIIPKLGITSAQILSTSVASHTDGLGLTIRFSADTTAEINAMDSTISSISVPLLTSGREIAFVCPSVLRVGVYTPLVKTRVAVFTSGDVALPTTTTITTTTTTTTAGPTTPSSTSVLSVAAATLTLALATLFVF